MPEFFAAPGTHAQKFDKVSGGVIPVVKMTRLPLPFRPPTAWAAPARTTRQARPVKPWHKSPGDLWDWAVQQPGARVVPDDELCIAWSA